MNSNRNERTLDNLRAGLRGKIHLYLRDEQTARQLLENAEAEGYRFGSLLPTQSAAEDIVALEEGKQLSHVGVAGRIAFGCNGGSHAGGTYHRIDYAAYLSGSNTYVL